MTIAATRWCPGRRLKLSTAKAPAAGVLGVTVLDVPDAGVTGEGQRACRAGGGGADSRVCMVFVA